METIQKINYKDHTIEISYDDYFESPRCWDQNSTMLIFHREYDFGDKNELGIDKNDFNDWDEMEEFLQKEMNIVVILPIYMMEHSGISIQTTPFSCSWDSGRVGFIYITRDQMKDAYGYKLLNARREKEIIRYLTNEVKLMNNYVTGDVYAYCIRNEDDEVLDSCSGFYGDDCIPEIIDECKRIIDTYPSSQQMTIADFIQEKKDDQ